MLKKTSYFENFSAKEAAPLCSSWSLDGLCFHTLSLVGVGSVHMLFTLQCIDPTFKSMVSGNHQSKDTVRCLVGCCFWTPTAGILNRSIYSQWYFGLDAEYILVLPVPDLHVLYKLKVRDKGSSSRLFLNLYLAFSATSPTVTFTCQGTGRERKIQPHISLQDTLVGALDTGLPGSSPGGSREFEGWTALAWEKLIYWLI